MSYTILMPETIAPDAFKAAEGRNDIVFERFAFSLPQSDFRARLAKVHAAILGLTPIADPELDVAPHLKVIARVGVGYDAIDVPALTRRGIPLMVTGIANSVSVAEQALAFMFAFAKRIHDMNDRVVSHRWMSRFENFPVDLFEKTVLVVGCGRIGSRMVKRCLGLEMNTLVYDPFIPQDIIRGLGARPVADLNEALAVADYVSIHCPKSPATVNLFDGRRLAAMKQGAVLINTARGGIVDEAALAAALQAGKLYGAGLDVYESEPPQADNPLLSLPQVISAPHMAGVTWEAWNRMAYTAVKNVLEVLDGKPNHEHTVNPQVYDGRVQ
ncbi:MAG: 3-phosphoglycerate dehydrogenase [Betaproteobacteria bacterium]|jgi:D-3-phosphoglycerate dehydrogenase|nr:3-phosphoglycerate dehydrogenase [Betaproteobacteria bacterium]